MKLNWPGVYPPEAATRNAWQAPTLSRAAREATRACGLYVLVWLVVLFGLSGVAAAEVQVSQKAAEAMQSTVVRTTEVPVAVALSATASSSVEAVLAPARSPGLPAVEARAQWRVPVVSSAGYKNLEIYLSNIGTGVIVFTNLAWEATNTEAEVAWRQFYPEPKVEPGRTTLLQINFRKAPSKSQMLRLQTEDRGSLTIKVPAWKAPDKQITGISYSRNLQTFFLQYQSRKVKPIRIWVNGLEIPNFRILRSTETDSPDMVVVQSPEMLKTGLPLHVAILFQDGTKQAALVRVLGEIVLDAYCLTSDKDRPLLGLDEKPSVGPMKCVMGGDVACYDVKKGQQGAAAHEVITERLKTYAAREEHLQAIHYCTARWTEMWDLYGRIADAVYINPYCLSYGHNISRWLDEEAGYMHMVSEAARPRPWLWIPDCFRRQARFTEPLELETLAWTALAKGCKGINYFAYKYKNDRGFADCLALLRTVKQLNTEIRTNVDRLVSLLPVSEKTVGAAENGVKIYTAWSGDQGMLVMVRNLDYRTDGATNDLIPRFSARKQNIAVRLTVPEWLETEVVRDFRTGQELPLQRNSRELIVKLEKLEAYRVLWLGQGEKHLKWYEFWKKWRRKS